MVLCEDGECSVCLLPYSRMDRIPRVLHCRHTFCEPCLETISRLRSGHLAVSCPLCRRVTCIGQERSLQEALWVDLELWERIQEAAVVEEQEEVEEEEDGQKRRAAVQRMEAKQQPALQAECVSWRPAALARCRLPSLLRRFSWTKPHRETVIPGSNNVEMKSWRRLSTDDVF
ncbi:PREDICTED: RING finger protein 186-like [Poecilia mexicana]|nr:PREDICTED: RING finger protein 186-like [Poecilia mexicana]XP_014830140.1 PREDICTED: RING finger protein 186-like [Poecilia mexicana]XP_014830150.1 PREDICTED: RING finger protein 186-like [Poecilia mexicana]